MERPGIASQQCPTCRVPIAPGQPIILHLDLTPVTGTPEPDNTVTIARSTIATVDARARDAARISREVTTRNDMLVRDLATLRAMFSMFERGMGRQADQMDELRNVGIEMMDSLRLVTYRPQAEEANDQQGGDELAGASESSEVVVYNLPGVGSQADPWVLDE